MTDSLTKENFWNAMMVAYPEQMKQFCAWIDEYKERVDWNGLFSCRMWSVKYDRPIKHGEYETHERHEVVPHQYKYHDLPLAMQFGIFIQFTAECNWEYSLQIGGHPDPSEYRGFIKMYFEENKPS